MCSNHRVNFKLHTLTSFHSLLLTDTVSWSRFMCAADSLFNFFDLFGNMWLTVMQSEHNFFYLQSKIEYMTAIMALWYSGDLFFYVAYVALSWSLMHTDSSKFFPFFGFSFHFFFVSFCFAWKVSNTFVNVWWNSPSKSHVHLFTYGNMLSVSIVLFCVCHISLSRSGGSNSSTTVHTVTPFIDSVEYYAQTQTCSAVTDGFVCMPTFINVMIHRFLSWTQILIIIVFARMVSAPACMCQCVESVYYAPPIHSVRWEYINVYRILYIYKKDINEIKIQYDLCASDARKSEKEREKKAGCNSQSLYMCFFLFCFYSVLLCFVWVGLCDFFYFILCSLTMNEVSTFDLNVCSQIRCDIYSHRTLNSWKLESERLIDAVYPRVKSWHV